MEGGVAVPKAGGRVWGIKWTVVDKWIVGSRKCAGSWGWHGSLEKQLFPIRPAEGGSIITDSCLLLACRLVPPLGV